MDLGLAGRRALITGGSRGLGFAAAKSFVQEGVEVVIAAHDPERLARAAAELSELSNRPVASMALDFSDPDAASRLAKAYGEVDILVNCAGGIPSGDLLGIDEARWRTTWDAKVFGYIKLMQAIYPIMQARGGGVMINVMGLGGEMPQWTYVIGGAGNAGLMAATMGIGGRSPDHNIRVLGVNPGPIGTDRMLDLQRQRAARQEAAGLPPGEADLPFGRAGRPEEVGDVIVFLASDRAGYISGTIVTIDGGMHHRHCVI
jgi:3-oxoacyl-[acyl-carrier protein] reductase